MSNPLIVILSMAGVVKFTNPLFNPDAVQVALRQIAALPFHGTMIIEHRDKHISNVSYSGSDESEIMDFARSFLRNDPEVVCVRLPRFNVVMYQ